MTAVFESLRFSYCQNLASWWKTWGRWIMSGCVLCRRSCCVRGVKHVVHSPAWHEDCRHIIILIIRLLLAEILLIWMFLRLRKCDFEILSWVAVLVSKVQCALKRLSAVVKVGTVTLWKIHYLLQVCIFLTSSKYNNVILHFEFSCLCKKKRLICIITGRDLSYS